MHLRARLLSLGLIASAATVLSAATAYAGALAPATNCPSESVSQVFLPWGDTAEYSLVPGGNFASGGPAWDLGGSAQVVAGGDGYELNGSISAQSLSLPSDSSATSPTVCVGAANPDIRLFVENTGDPSSTLAVDVVVESSSGNTYTFPVDRLTATSSWEPTAQIPIYVNYAAGSGETPVSFTFTPQGQGGNWQIDDVYIDPMGMGG